MVSCLIPVFLTVMILWPVHRTDSVDVLSVGQGDCICIRDHTGKTIIVDAGSSDVKEAGLYRLIPYLKYNGISHVNAVFVTHAHTDHYSAVLELLQNGSENGITVGTLCIGPNQGEACETLINAARNNKTKIRMVCGGEKMQCGRIMLTCLFPDAETVFTQENDASLVMHASIGGFTMLLTGDSSVNCDDAVMQMLSRQHFGSVDFLKVAHHGSNSSTGDRLLAYLQPKIAVISCGKDNKYGHPHKETMEKLKKTDAMVYITKDDGQIRMQKTRKGWHVTAYSFSHRFQSRY